MATQQNRPATETPAPRPSLQGFLERAQKLSDELEDYLLRHGLSMRSEARHAAEDARMHVYQGGRLLDRAGEFHHRRRHKRARPAAQETAAPGAPARRTAPARAARGGARARKA